MTPINVDKEIYVRTTIRELVVYCIFITVLCLITFGMQSQTQFYYTKVMSIHVMSYHGLLYHVIILYIRL